MWFGAPFILKIGPTVFDFYFLFCIATYKIIKQTKGAMIVFSCEETKIELGLKPFFYLLELTTKEDLQKSTYGRQPTNERCPLEEEGQKIFFLSLERRGGDIFL